MSKARRCDEKITIPLGVTLVLNVTLLLYYPLMNLYGKNKCLYRSSFNHQLF